MQAIAVIQLLGIGQGPSVAGRTAIQRTSRGLPDREHSSGEITNRGFPRVDEQGLLPRILHRQEIGQDFKQVGDRMTDIDRRRISIGKGSPIGRTRPNYQNYFGSLGGLDLLLFSSSGSCMEITGGKAFNCRQTSYHRGTWLSRIQPLARTP